MSVCLSTHFLVARQAVCFLLLLLVGLPVTTVLGSVEYGYYAFRNHLPAVIQGPPWHGQLGELSASSPSPTLPAAAALKQLLEPVSAGLVAARMLEKPGPADTVSGMSACANQTASLLLALSTGKAWALVFLDADAKPPAALSYGGLTWLGSYDLCMTAAAATAGEAGISSGGFQGGYCLSPVRISGRGQEAGGLASPLLRLGMCWPRDCTSEQAANLTQLLLSAAQAAAGLNATLAVVPGATQCKRPRGQLPLTPQAIVMLSVLSLFASLVLAATLYDLCLVYRHGKESGAEDQSGLVNEATGEGSGASSRLVRIGLAGKFLLCFSAYTNAARIVDVTQADGTLTCVHGLRFASMLWVILGHTYYFAFPALNNMGQLYTGWQNDWTFQVVANATVAVDSFFVLSGLLSTVLFFRELSRVGNRLRRVNWLMFYLHRYWRLTPPYLLVMASYVCLFQYIYEGPLYPQEPGGIDPDCPQYWWMNALYINNLAAPDGKQCMAWSWYLANDMQFYAVSPLFLALLARWPPVGVGVVLAALLASVTGMGVHSTLSGLRVGFFGIMQEFSGIYIRPWFRAPPYLIGVLAGYALHRLLPGQGVRRPLAWPVRLAAWLTAAGIGLSIVYGLYDVDGGRETLGQCAASFYNALYRPAWGLAVAWVTLACVTGNGGWINRLLSAPAIVPLSRLTYCAYLVHPVAMMVYSLSRRQAMVWDDFSVVHAFLSNAVLSYALAFAASLLFEAPLIGLERVLRGR